MSELNFKVLGPDGACCHGGSGRWLTDGTWMPLVFGNLSPCVRGYHLCRRSDLVEWLGEVIWVAEGRGKSFVSPQYLIFQEARVVRALSTWTPTVARGFAVTCAERVLPLLEAALPGEERPAEALRAARTFDETSPAAFEQLGRLAQAAWTASRGLDGALRDVALAAYGSAVWRGAGMAAWAASASARSAAAAAAVEEVMARARENGVHPRDAERNANAASASALKAERDWQTERLFDLLGPLGEAAA